MLFLRSFLTATLVLTTCLLAPVASAKPNVQAPENYVFVIDQDLNAVLKAFARGARLTAEINPDLHQRVRNQRIPLDPERFLQFINQQYNVQAVIDGSTLRASTSGEKISRMFTLNSVSLRSLTKACQEAGINLEQYGLRRIPESNAIILEASPEILGKVSALLETLNVSSEEQNIIVVRYGHVQEEKAIETTQPRK